MKKIFSKALLFFCLFIAGNVFSQTQLKGWHVAPNLLDMQSVTSSTGPTVKPVFTGLSASGSAYNSVYDSEGKLLLYVAGNAIYNKFNTALASLVSGPNGIQTNVEIIPNPSNSGCFNKYYVVYAEGLCCGSPTNIKYVEIDMSMNQGLGGVSTAATTLISISSSSFPSFATSKVVGNKRFFYLSGGFTWGDKEIRKYDVTASGFSSPTLIASAGTGSFESAELELSNNGDKLVWAEGSPLGGAGTNDVNMIYLNPTTGLTSGVPNYIFSTNSTSGTFKGIEFDITGNKLFVSKSGTGILVKDLTVPASTAPVLIAGTSAFSNSMLEKSFNGTEIICASKSLGQVRSINAASAVLNTWIVNYTLPSVSLGNQIVLMPSQIDGENYDATGTINVDVNQYTTTVAFPTWTATSNPFYALQQNSYLGTLTSFSTVRVAKSIDVPSGVSTSVNGMTFEFQTNAEWNVNGGGNLTVNSSTLQSHPCGLMWRGIIINNNNSLSASTFRMQAASKLYDAIKGAVINGTNVTTIITQSSEFNKNERSVVFNNANPATTTVVFSKFLATIQLKDQTYGQQINGTGAKFGITGIEINNCGTSTSKFPIGISGLGNQFESGQYGIKATASDLVIINNTFKTVDNKAIDMNSNWTNRSCDLTSNIFTSNRNGISSYFGSSLKAIKNTFTASAEKSIDWNYNGGCKLDVGTSATIDANTFDGFGWVAIATSLNEHANTEISIQNNTIKNSSWATGVSILESTLTSNPTTYKGYLVKSNTFTSVGRAINVSNIRGNADFGPMGDVNLNSSKFDILSNVINFSVAYDVNANGIKMENCVGNRVLSNTVISDLITDWQNTGIRIVSSPNSLVKSNYLKAGAGIRLGLDMTGSNVLCNTLDHCVIGIEPGWSWIRSAGSVHGGLGDGRQNLFISNYVDIQVYNSSPVYYQWASPNTTNIIYAGVTGNIIYSTGDLSPCGGGSTRLASTSNSIRNYEITNTFPNGYTENVFEAQALNKQFASSANGSQNELSSQDNEMGDIAKALILSHKGEYKASNSLLMQFSGSHNAIAKNLVNVLTIQNNMKLEGRYEYTVEEKSILVSIASSDSRLGGQGVYFARAIVLANYNLGFEDPYTNYKISFDSNKEVETGLGLNSGILIGLYPNPTNSEVNIELSDNSKTLNIYNSLGQKVYTSESNSKLKLDVSTWEKGIYLVVVIDAVTNQKETSKFVIE